MLQANSPAADSEGSRRCSLSQSIDPCNLYRIDNTQLNTPMRFRFQAADPYGFVDRYRLATTRCPGTTIGLNVLPPPMTNLAAGVTTLDEGVSASVKPVCAGYGGTNQKFTTTTSVEVVLTPTLGSWIQAGEVFTRYNFGLTAAKRVTNGYNTGIDNNYRRHADIFIQPLNP